MGMFFYILILAYLAGNYYIFRKLYGLLSFLPRAAAVCAGIFYWFGCLSLFIAMAFRNTPLPPAVHSALFVTGGSWMAFTLYMVPLLLLADLAAMAIPGLRRWTFGLAFIPVLFILVLGNLKYRHPDINRIDVALDKPLSGGSVRIVAVSDVHLGFGTGKKALRRYVDMINAENPDVVVIGGDLIDSSLQPLYVQKMYEELAGLHAGMGIYMVPGNHEYISGIEECVEFLAQTPVVLLRDSVVTLPCGLQVAGRDDRINSGRMDAASFVATADAGIPVLLLDHQPYGLAENDALGIDVQFSGHTHDGQLWPGNLIVRGMYEQPSGWRRWEHAFIYVSSGLSLWGPPFRIGTSSDMAVLTLHGK